MYYIKFLLKIAELQLSLGRGVRAIDIMRSLNMPRSTVHRYINELIDSGMLVRVGYGKYKILMSDDNMKLGLCLVTPLDVLTYSHINQTSEALNAT